MKRAAPLLLLLLAGCSTAPFADLLDFFLPGRVRGGDTPPFGGVCIPQGGPIVAPPAPVIGGPAPPPPAAVVPPAPTSPFREPGVIPPPGAGGNEVPITRPF